MLERDEFLALPPAEQRRVLKRMIEDLDSIITNSTAPECDGDFLRLLEDLAPLLGCVPQETIDRWEKEDNR